MHFNYFLCVFEGTYVNAGTYHTITVLAFGANLAQETDNECAVLVQSSVLDTILVMQKYK